MRIKDALLALEEASELGRLWASVDRHKQIVHVHYVIPDTNCSFTGTLSFHNRDITDYASRILAAAASVSGKPQCDPTVAESVIHSSIRPHALKILTNRTAWTLCGHTKKTVVK